MTKVKKQKNGEWIELFDGVVWNLKKRNNVLTAVNLGKKMDDIPKPERYLIPDRGFHSPKEEAEKLGLDIKIVEEKDIVRCPQCSSDWIVRNGILTRSGYRIQRYQCKECGYSFTLNSNNTKKKKVES